MPSKAQYLLLHVMLWRDLMDTISSTLASFSSTAFQQHSHHGTVWFFLLATDLNISWLWQVTDLPKQPVTKRVKMLVVLIQILNLLQLQSGLIKVHTKGLNVYKKINEQLNTKIMWYKFWNCIVLLLNDNIFFFQMLWTNEMLFLFSFLRYVCNK